MATRDALGFVGTIDENDDIAVEPESSDSEDEQSKIQKKTIKHGKGDFKKGFCFTDQTGEDYSEFDYALSMAKKKSNASSLDDKISKIRKEKKKLNPSSEADPEAPAAMDDETRSDDDSGEEIKPDTIKIKEKRGKKRKAKDIEEEVEKQKFSEDIESYDENTTFQNMNVSRPLLKALSHMSFQRPTPIQAATIPVALLGKDICACAVTGSGKTVAFMLPILERLLYKPKQSPITRVLVLVPTRELAVQVHQVSRQLAQHTNIDITLSAGGLDLKSQEAALRLGPDVVVATPGRLIDHIHNAPNFTLNNIEILVLDEADRMLDEYFAEQMKEVIRLCSRTRQTMLFSATMTDEVKDLAAVSLNKPVRIFINENTEVAFELRQEFIRIRPNREGDREAIVSALVSRTFQDHCIIFIQTKKQAHRLHILLGLQGINVGELHGNLSQTQRLEALKKFKEAEIDVLLATDLAARGLDIDGVKTVINFTMPNTIKHYVHRVGRTARAGKRGRSVTLAGEKERKMLKEIVKKAKTPVKSRIIPTEVVCHYRDKIESLETDIVQVDRQEQEEKEFRVTELKINTAKNMLEDPQSASQNREWFQTRKERMQEKANLRLGEYDTSKKKKKNKKFEKKVVGPDDRVVHELIKSQAYAARASKKSFKAQRMRGYKETEPKSKKNKNRGKGNEKKSSFVEELTNTGRTALKKFRSGPSYQERKELGIGHKQGRRKQTNLRSR